jgi:uncharacterized UPF0146 family protein
MPSHKDPDVEPATRDAIVARLSDADVVVEVAIGTRTVIAASLADRGVDVTATDVRDRTVPTGVTFERDDLTEPDLAIYRGADVLFAQNLPAELQRPAREVATAVEATLHFTTLGAEQPVIDVTRETAPGETLYRAAGTP